MTESAKIYKWLYRNKIVVGFFLVAVILNSIYGPLLYSKVLGKQEAYAIGQFCTSSRTECESTYFQDYLNKINSVSTANRDFFSKIVIQEDQSGYTGNCPCPYDTDSRDYSCGGRSSYSKGGKVSYCYDSDVSDSQIAQLRTSMIADATKSLNEAVQKDLDVYNEKVTLILIVIVFGALAYRLEKKRLGSLRL
jgi:hypothetical protein